MLPGEPDDEKQLNKMIDAPLGDRSKWKPHWPPLEPLFIPIGKARIARARAGQVPGVHDAVELVEGQRDPARERAEFADLHQPVQRRTPVPF